MRRLAAIVVAVSAAACAGAPVTQSLAAGALRGANVLLVTIDTLRADRVGAYGSARGLTPTTGMVTALGDLKIVGVRPKPAGLSKDLRSNDPAFARTESARRSLQSKGYFLAPTGDLVSMQGDVFVETEEGVVYTLRFGEVDFTVEIRSRRVTWCGGSSWSARARRRRCPCLRRAAAGRSGNRLDRTTTGRV